MSAVAPTSNVNSITSFLPPAHLLPNDMVQWEPPGKTFGAGQLFKLRLHGVTSDAILPRDISWEGIAAERAKLMEKSEREARRLTPTKQAA